MLSRNEAPLFANLIFIYRAPVPDNMPESNKQLLPRVPAGNVQLYAVAAQLIEFPEGSAGAENR